MHVTTTFSLKQGETRTSSGPIPHPLTSCHIKKQISVTRKAGTKRALVCSSTRMNEAESRGFYFQTQKHLVPLTLYKYYNTTKAFYYGSPLCDSGLRSERVTSCDLLYTFFFYICPADPNPNSVTLAL